MRTRNRGMLYDTVVLVRTAERSHPGLQFDFPRLRCAGIDDESWHSSNLRETTLGGESTSRQAPPQVGAYRLGIRTQLKRQPGRDNARAYVQFAEKQQQEHRLKCAFIVGNFLLLFFRIDLILLLVFLL